MSSGHVDELVLDIADSLTPLTVPLPRMQVFKRSRIQALQLLQYLHLNPQHFTLRARKKALIDPVPNVG